MIEGGTPTIYVSDMDRAVEFYTAVLGLRLESRYGDEWASVDAGRGMTIGLHPAAERMGAPGTLGSINVGFNVTESLDEVVRTLENRGVTFDGPIRGDANGSIRLAFFGDPDGNSLYLCESKY
jgi:catechol 2,3-dioxygenase-like lactoylglutathione lyase family enzyme